MKLTILIMMIVLITLTYAQQNCRFTADSGSCVRGDIKNCMAGSVFWNYPRNTCKFPISTEKNQKKAHLLASPPPISWVIEDIKGKEIEKGNGILNKTMEFSKTKGLNVVLTYPSRMNLFGMNLWWKFQQ
eukprot:gene3354-5901_t